MRYIIVSHRGRTPFAETRNRTQAAKLSREAQQLGLSGEIVTYPDERELRATAEAGGPDLRTPKEIRFGL